MTAQIPQLGELANTLRALREAAGSPTYRVMAELVHYSASSLSGAASGTRMPSWEVTAAYLRACEAGEQDTELVRNLWVEADAVITEGRSSKDTLMTQDGPADPSGSAAAVPEAGAAPGAPEQDTAPAARVGLGRWRPNLTRRPIVALGASIVLIAALIVGAVIWWPGPCDTATTSEAPTGQCIGVSAGDFVFAPALADVSNKIAAQNADVDERVAADPGTEAVSVAFLLPYPPEDDTRNTSLAVGLRRELQGAYIAQLRANNTNEAGGRAPLIRLLLANAGDDNAQWRPVVDQLIEMAQPGSQQRLVSVIGFGVSLDTSRDAITALNQARVATIVSRLTADDLSATSGAPASGFARIAPTNTDEAAAAVDYLHRNAKQVLVIRDKNSADLYTTTLAERFIAGYPDTGHSLIQPVEEYDSSLPAVANAFYQITPTICAKAQATQSAARSAGQSPPPMTIYFAGRSADLSALVSALGARSCPTIAMTVFTGDDGGQFATAVQAQYAAKVPELPRALGSITVRFTALANPGAWVGDSQEATFAGTGYFLGNCSQCYRTLFPAERSDDDAAIIGHDAMFTAAVAVRGLVDQRDAQLPENPAGALVQQLYRLHDAQAVPGASGRISFGPRGDPQRKPIPIVEVGTKGEVRFVELATGR